MTPLPGGVALSTAVRLRMIGEGDAEQVGDLALVPAQQGPGIRKTRNAAVSITAPDREGRIAGGTCDIAQFEFVRRTVPGIGHLHADA